ISNSFGVCAVRGVQIICPNSAATDILNSLPAGSRPAGLTVGPTGPITETEANNSPFLVRLSTRVRDFQLHADTNTRVLSHYVQDEFKVSKTMLLNLGMRWDYQQSYANGGQTYVKLNQFMRDAQPRLGFVWDYTGKAKGKFSASYARFLETPIPLDVNVRAGGGDAQTDKNFNVNRLNAAAGSTIVPGIRAALTTGAVNLGSEKTPIDPGLRPQTVDEWTAGFEYEAVRDLVLGIRGVYRNQVNVIEDGSFDDGDTYLLFNPGRRGHGETTEDKACGDPAIGCFGHARRYYRALEFTATKRFTSNYQIIASYTFSSLTGNYEGLFRNGNKAEFAVHSGTATIPKVNPSQPGFPNLVDSVGSNRSPVTYNTDIGVYYPIKVQETRELRLTADWFNVFNTQRALTLDKTFQLNSGITGVPPITNPFWGAALLVQPPSQWRFGAKFSF